MTTGPRPRSAERMHLLPRVWKDNPALDASPMENRFLRNSATAHVPDGISLKVANQSRRSVICSVAPESAYQACLSRLTLKACERLLITMNAWVSGSDSGSEVSEQEVGCSDVAAQASLCLVLENR